MLEQYIRRCRQDRDILLMTHIVLGYPSMDASLRIVEAMVEGGVELMELQIPFSEPMADGPVILRANSGALAKGATVEQCLALAEQVSSRFDIPFLFMTYYNILYKYGEERFARAMRARRIAGAIIPDLPPEEAESYLAAMQAEDRDPIFLFTPNTPDARMRMIAEQARGFIYCVARKGVTGAETHFSREFDAYVGRCRAATNLPLALGFGVRERADVDFLKGKVDIAVVGSETIRIVDTRGVSAVEAFIRGLRD